VLGHHRARFLPHVAQPGGQAPGAVPGASFTCEALSMGPLRAAGSIVVPVQGSSSTGRWQGGDFLGSVPRADRRRPSNTSRRRGRGARYDGE
jgi:hypothetical protein